MFCTNSKKTTIQTLLHLTFSQLDSDESSRGMNSASNQQVCDGRSKNALNLIHQPSFMSPDNEKNRIMQDKMNQMIRRGMPAKFNRNDQERIENFLRWEKDK